MTSTYRTTCKHCGDPIKFWDCDRGGKTHTVIDECCTCHNEISHGIVINQNIHICSSPTRRPQDEDANGGWSNIVRESEDPRE